MSLSKNFEDRLMLSKYDGKCNQEMTWLQPSQAWPMGRARQLDTNLHARCPLLGWVAKVHWQPPWALPIRVAKKKQVWLVYSQQSQPSRALPTGFSKQGAVRISSGHSAMATAMGIARGL
jgi:hypothetical protein